MLKINSTENLSDLSNITIDYSWSFIDKTIKDTSYITHGYYTYPAKFIPQLASRLINEYSNENDIVVDPFMGSGTTIIEAIVNNRVGIGNDINEIAYLLSKVKTTPIKSSDLLKEFNLIKIKLESRFNGNYEKYLSTALKNVPNNDRIDYWFLPSQKEKLAIIFATILEVKDIDIRDFFLISFAQILKSCSIWMQKSIKPTRDMKKKIYEPIILFYNQSNKMIKRHYEFDKILPDIVKNNIDKYRMVNCADSRKINCKDNTATLIVSSPPYVTSYEYADLHQLPSLWFGYLNELSEFRQKFIGSAYKNDSTKDIQSNLGKEIVNNLGKTKKIKRC